MDTESCTFPSALDMNKLPIVRIKLNPPPLRCIAEGIITGFNIFYLFIAQIYQNIENLQIIL